MSKSSRPAAPRLFNELKRTIRSEVCTGAMANVVDQQRKFDLLEKLAIQFPSYKIARYERWSDLISATLSLFIPSIQVLWSPFISFYALPPGAKPEEHEPTWQELVSRVVLILLLAIKVPFAMTGAFIEWLLNFYYYNNGIVGLLFKLICSPGGIVLVPPKDKEYRSVIGWMDQRTDLMYPYSMRLKVDPKTGEFDYDSKQFADLCIMASKFAYESEIVQKAIVNDQWKMNYQKFYECPNAHAYAPGFLQELIRGVLAFVRQILCIQRQILCKVQQVIILLPTFVFEFLIYSLDTSIAAMKVLEEWTSLHPKTYAFTFMNKEYDADLIVLAFRGTEPFSADAWSTDFDFSFVKVPGVGRLHWGFLQALGLVDKRDCEGSASRFIQNLNDADKPYATGLLKKERMVYEKSAAPYDHLAFDWIHTDLKQLLLENPKAKLVITGHSLGGALAALFAGLIFIKKTKDNFLLERLAAVYTFGQPRIGDKEFATFMTSKIGEHMVQYFRVVFSFDIVPRVPFDDRIFGFKHFGGCSYNTILHQQKALIEEPDANFADVIFSVVTRMLAIVELVNGAVFLRLLYGDDFRDSGLMAFARLIDLFLPGAVAHMPTNYVNAVRLGPSELRRVPLEAQQD
ncbi:hypothetical protein KP509_23G068500 [Ceratopteris richardii]|uniref:Fungal lipase-type domain-containing protein n=1 Tax=Ceratopteris richardii TaxID=49495 RepID=A0A8T2S3E6_CERRI|nr:hypothetical protein KP509_23G068500 [Ceratopteris richardii]